MVLGPCAWPLERSHLSFSGTLEARSPGLLTVSHSSAAHAGIQSCPSRVTAWDMDHASHASDQEQVPCPRHPHCWAGRAPWDMWQGKQPSGLRLPPLWRALWPTVWDTAARCSQSLCIACVGTSMEPHNGISCKLKHPAVVGMLSAKGLTDWSPE